ncbi:YbbR-like domain-containing protein [Tenacibaculum caenipelagi]|uniref:YbbR-like protein n=1 Tax=Tenacibaculum caenipelagi TaxID=1325435 RepID=A0A4R6THY8_9FLAO|nr:hypothetical protein [Tenacibaculum caenipelagi]TDQ27942.1 hypothetical protein DFQ07_1800 [Tenacibaculum caenipelagi]
MKKKFNIPKTFFGFLTTSIFFWLLINLSKEYNAEVEYDIEYTKLSLQKTLISTPVKKITLILKSSGYNLFASGLTHKPIQLNLNEATKKKGNEYFFLSKNLLPKIQNQLKSGIQLLEIKQDSIPLKIGVLSSKKISLKADLNVTFQLGYDFSKPITITPDSIIVSGDETYLNNLHSLNLEKVVLENLSENKNVTTPIIFPEDVQLKANHKSVNIQISVDKFTEGEIEVPVVVKNAPKGINIFPKKVKIIYKVGLKNFNDITPDLFKVECDYTQSKDNGINYLTPKLKSVPDLVTLIRIVPDKIDFLTYE